MTSKLICNITVKKSFLRWCVDSLCIYRSC